MKKRFAALPLLAGVIIVAVAGIIVWNNLAGRPLFAKAGAAAAAPPAQAPGSATGPGGGAAPAREVTAGRPTGRVQTHPVETQTAEIGSLRSVVKLTGEVAAATRVNVFPEVAGKVDQINVAVGSRVDTGATLLTVDPSRPGTRYEASPVRSPIAGTVIDIPVKRGQTVTTSTATVTVATISDLEMSVRIPERYAAVVDRRSIARVTFDALGGKSFDARVKRLQPVIDPTSRSKEVVFAIPAGTPGIEPGMFGSLELVARQVDNAVIVPFETIVQEGDQSFVFIAQEGKAIKRPVSVGLLAGEMIEIRSGLAGGESVISTGQSFLEDGSPISVVGQTAGRVGTAQSRQ